tara:strand:- start:66 stop:380 length:315 start_codon:yes stop_codon:yes gene_type:complete
VLSYIWKSLKEEIIKFFIMLKLLGILDLLTVAFYILVGLGVGSKIGIIFGAYLIIKSLIFITDWVSWIDLLAGVYLFLVIYDVHSAFSFLFILWLLQKSFFSLI